jgi:hypothetical protein
MSTGFNWFKDYEIYLADDYYNDYNLRYVGGDSTAHSAGNIIKVQNLLEKYGDIRIPSIRTYDVGENYELDLVNPKLMSEVCNKILENSDVDKTDMRHRIELFKKVSDEGYYLSYDLNW